MAAAAISVTASLGGGATPDDLGAVLGAPAGATAFGVFEPLRGRIVYVAGDELRAIDPADPTSVATVALPDELWDKGPVVAGWSADGTPLAPTTEGSDGKAYVMDADGVITQARSELGCCTFVREPSFDRIHTPFSISSPLNGSTSAICGGGPSRVIELYLPVAEDLPSWLIPIHAWSPEGTRIAYTPDQQLGVRV